MLILVQSNPPRAGTEAIVLVPDNWDDYGFLTTYTLWYRNHTKVQELGRVKIGVAGQAPGRALPMGELFSFVPRHRVFSVGQDDVYYVNIRKLGSHTRSAILDGLRDLAFSPELLDEAMRHDVTTVSLLRSVEEQTVRAQFNRIARGGVQLTEYVFNYQTAQQSYDAPLDFKVDPYSMPSTNIHVLIGRNGVGKTTLLRDLAGAVVDAQSRFGRVTVLPTATSKDGERFVNVVSVSFSAFDPFVEVVDTHAPRGAQYTYVGLYDARTRALKSSLELAEEFRATVREVVQTQQFLPWLRALESLSRDPQFAESHVAIFARSIRAGQRITEDDLTALRKSFSQMSSGHAVVLLTMTKLALHVVEQSLVLIDEPEAHLHPPLLSSFVRALSDLLTARNGVAVLATHSPVVLQEVPSSCVYKLSRNGRNSRARRPRLETYGENVGILTHEIFGLEVMESGFYAEIARATADLTTYDEVLERFAGRLGSEAKGLVRILISERQESGEES
jgi:predicted ATPase